MSPQQAAPRGLVAGSDGRRAEYLRDLGPTLWPGVESSVTRRSRSGTSAREYLIVPSAGSPRLLVPTGSRAAAAAAVKRYSAPSSIRARGRLLGVSLSLRSGIGDRLFSDRLRVGWPPDDTSGTSEEPTIEDYLGGVLGDVVLSIHVGPARANRKPVLQALDGKGRTVAFVKLGVNDLTRSLVRGESAALANLATEDLRSLVVPRVLHHGVWSGNEVLVQSALPVWRRRSRGTARRLNEAMVEVAGLDGVRTTTLETSSFLARLGDTTSRLKGNETRTVLLQACEHVTRRSGDALVSFGPWHGDWAPWNVAYRGSELLVWDWERFERDVPVGFDALHHFLQQGVVRERIEPRRAVEALLDSAPRLLRNFEVEAGSEQVVALLYLISIAARYAGDGQAEAGARLGVLGSWLLPVLQQRISHL